MRSPLNLLIIIVLVLLLIGLLPAWPYSANWGYFPSGGLGLLLVVVVVLLLVNGGRGNRPLIP